MMDCWGAPGGASGSIAKSLRRWTAVSVGCVLGSLACGEPTPAMVVYALDQQAPDVQQVTMAALPMLLRMRLTLSDPSALYAALSEGLFVRQRSADHRFVIQLCDEEGMSISSYFIADFEFMQKVSPSALVSLEGAYLQAPSPLLPNSGPVVHNLVQMPLTAQLSAADETSF